MRNFFLLLLLANFGAFAVYHWVVEKPAVRAPYAGPGITLLRELEPEDRADQEAELADAPIGTVVDTGDDGDDGDNGGVLSEPEQPVESSVPDLVTAAESRCISIGPFTEEAAADTARATLAEAGFDPRPATRESEVWEGYWVYLDRIDSMQAAREIAADLGANGIDDTQIIPNTDSGTVLSLGVFSEISRAGTQAERVNRFGYEATIADSMRTRETHWLDVTLTSEESLALDLLQVPGTISRLEQLACGSDAAE